MDANAVPDRHSSSKTGENGTPSAKVDLHKSAVIKSSSDFTLHGCKVTRAKLNRLWDLASEGFSPDSYILIKSKIKGKVESSVESKSIDGVMEGAGRTVIASDPSHLDNMNLYISEGRRTVSIRLQGGWDLPDEGVSVSVGGDEEWVRGRSDVLRELLESTRSPLLAGRGHLRGAVAIIGFIIGEIISIPIANPTDPNSTIVNYIVLTLSLDAALAGGGYFAATLIDRRMRTRLILLPEEHRSKVDPVSIASLLIGILGIIVAIIAMLVAHSDALTGH